MSCCGDSRKELTRHLQQRAEPKRVNRSVPERFPVPPWQPVVLEYLGRRGVIVRGPITSRLYRFRRKGAKVAVDRRDAHVLTARPGLWRAS
jgi:hypothetical protein